MSVVAAICLVVLVGMAALTLDVGNLYWERRQLQVGAEAGALAAAQDFASGEGEAAAEASARTFTSENNTRDAFVEDIYQPTSNSVTVETITGSAGSAGVLDAFLAGVIGNDTYFSRASATATWGGIGSASTIPLTFSSCEWKAFTGLDPGATASEIDAALPTATQVVYHHTSSASDVNDCDGPAGQDYPGGFGWLDTNDEGECTADVVLGTVDGDTGNSPPVPAASTGCTSDFFNSLLGQTVLMPIFDDVTGNGSNAVYNVIGFAALEVTGYRFGGSLAGTVPTASIPCGNPLRCIRGQFVAYYDLGEEPDNTAPEFGAYTIALTG